MLISIVSVQVGASFAKQLFPALGAEGVTAMRQGFSTLVLFALFQPWKGRPQNRQDWILVLLYGALLGAVNSVLWQPHYLLLGFGVAVLSGAIPYTLEMLALNHIPAKTFSLMMSLEPAVAALAALVMLHERLTLWQWLAIGLVIIASAGSSPTAKRTVDAVA